MSIKIGYALLYGIIAAVTVGFFSWVITGNVNNFFQIMVFLGATGISLLAPPKNMK